MKKHPYESTVIEQSIQECYKENFETVEFKLRALRRKVITLVWVRGSIPFFKQTYKQSASWEEHLKGIPKGTLGTRYLLQIALLFRQFDEQKPNLSIILFGKKLEKKPRTLKGLINCLSFAEICLEYLRHYKQPDYISFINKKSLTKDYASYKLSKKSIKEVSKFLIDETLILQNFILNLISDLQALEKGIIGAHPYDHKFPLTKRSDQRLLAAAFSAVFRDVKEEVLRLQNELITDLSIQDTDQQSINRYPLYLKFLENIILSLSSGSRLKDLDSRISYALSVGTIYQLLVSRKIPQHKTVLKEIEKEILGSNEFSSRMLAITEILLKRQEKELKKLRGKFKELIEVHTQKLSQHNQGTLALLQESAKGGLSVSPKRNGRSS